MKVLITGSSGVGKSSTLQELAKRGFTVFDGDEVPGLSRLEVKETGEPAEWPDTMVDWSYYAWSLQADVLKKILATDDTVFLAAFNGNQPDFYPLFDKIIALTLPPAEHRRRMLARPRRSANDDPENIEERIQKYPKILQHLVDAGAICVDASGMPSETADKILELSGLA